MKKFYEVWEPILQSFKEHYECMCYEKHIDTHEVVDWHPSGYLELTATMSNGEILVYEWLGNRIYPIRPGRTSSTMELRVNESEDDWKNNFSKNLRARMNRRCIGNDRLSDMTGISKVTLSKYLNGHAVPSGYNLEKIARALNCSMSELTLVR